MNDAPTHIKIIIILITFVIYNRPCIPCSFGVTLDALLDVLQELLCLLHGA